MSGRCRNRGPSPAGVGQLCRHERDRENGERFAVLAAAQGRYARAAALRAAHHKLDDFGPHNVSTSWLERAFLSDLPTHLDPDELSAAEQAGRRLTIDQVTRIILDDAPIPIDPEPVPLPRPVLAGHAVPRR
jgi:hypothetical protein